MKIHISILLLAFARNTLATKHHDLTRGVTSNRQTLSNGRGAYKKDRLQAMRAAQRMARKPRHLYYNKGDKNVEHKLV